MTTRIKIENVGPEATRIKFYNRDRMFDLNDTLLAVGETLEVDVWDGHIPVVCADGPPEAIRASTGEPPKLFATPPAGYSRGGR